MKPVLAENLISTPSEDSDDDDFFLACKDCGGRFKD